ncbi:KEOPS complex subunit Pcc1 [Natronorubrum sp. DTA7]|uniref:KEOPS complex subunit Pcc1 n=1 Tax=Natronorubrum sp. DTA7 TaxID=3447016 RepID=UPI003F87F263
MSSHDATLEFDYETSARATLVAESVAREIGEIDDDRSRTTIDRDGATVRVDVVAADVIALRAALNTWFSLIDVAERTAELGDAALES